VPIAVFDYGLWSARYPELAATVDQALATAYFAEAGLYLTNDDCSPVRDVTRRGILLNMLTAHIASLQAAQDASAGTAGIGRDISATEGGVSITQGYVGPQSGTEAWYALTTYGWAYWQATRGLRTARYVAPPARNFEPYLGSPGGFGWPR
jgi:hypothetical protein